MENSIPENLGTVYLIRNPENDFCYVGSTSRSLKYRLTKHISDYKRWKTDFHHFTPFLNFLKPTVWTT